MQPCFSNFSTQQNKQITIRLGKKKRKTRKNKKKTETTQNQCYGEAFVVLDLFQKECQHIAIKTALQGTISTATNRDVTMCFSQNRA